MMKKFGIVGEGYTDKVVIEYILRGFFAEQDLEDEINPLPEGDKGGWEIICKYLASKDFRSDVSNHETLVLQIDTDITTKAEDSIKFGVSHQDEHGRALSVEELLIKVKDKLISEINSGKSGFYDLYADKIIFAISVHTTECWLVAYFSKQSEIYRCDEVLRDKEKTKLPNNIQFSKKQKSGCHEKLSLIAFETRESIEMVAQKDTSFKHFIQQLTTLSL
jgi:hypothetical protein